MTVYTNRQEKTINWIKSKKVIIYGTGKIQKDFEYIFDWISCEYYIDDACKIKMDKKIFNIEKIKEENINDILIIACVIDKMLANQEFMQLGLEYKKNYLFIEDLLFLLDEIDEEYISSKDVYIWGCGETQKNLELGLKKNGYQFAIRGYIDSNPQKWGELVSSPEILSEMTEAYIIIASIYYTAIKKQLEEMGKVEGKDFACFSKFMARPSLMMLKTMYDLPLKKERCQMMERMSYTCFGIYPCCVSWVDYPIGNPVVDSCEDSWNSLVMKLYRLSVENRTYSFCKKGVCNFLPKSSFLGEYNIGTYQKKYSVIPRQLALGLDDSCNLHCESCRNEVKYAKGGLLEERKKYAEKIISSGWLEKVDDLFMSIDGEVFASEVDRMVLFGEHALRKNIHILTNGNLLDETNWKLLERSYEKIWISISIDAASEETYTILRRGGNWRRLQKNLEMLSKYRKEGKIERIEIRMVVQRKNYREMVDFVKMGQKYQFDQVIFCRINNYGTYTDDVYADISMVDKDGFINDELEEILKNPIFDNDIVKLNEFAPYRRTKN